MFNTLKYAKMLEEVGFSREQAETSIRILVEIMEDKLATKIDLQGATVSSKQEIALLRHEMREMESRIIIRIGAMQAASVAIIVALVKLL